MATNVSHPQGFWSAVRDVVRCNRKDGKRWQCSREVVPGQKYCERHVGRGRNRPKRSTEGYSATSDVAAAPSVGAVSSVTMAAAVHDVYAHRPRPLSSDEANHGVRDVDHTFLPCGFDRIARMKILYDRIRSNFPYFDSALNKGQMQLALMDNAGGSQCPQVVIDAMYNYMKTSYVQPGAGYDLSRRADETVKTAHEHMKTFANAHGFGEVVFGQSTSQLLMNLSNCFGSVLKEGDELVIHEANHEANVSPWVRMAAGRGAIVKWWRISYDTFESNLEDLAKLLSSRTRVVAVAHVSNLLGGILNLETLVKVVKSRTYESPVRVVADGAAFAPHRAVDVGKWGVDWYVFSSCKVYGPHIAVLYGSQDAFMELRDETASWDFLSSDDVSEKLELGSVCQEACAGLIGLTHYWGVLSRIGEAFCVSLEGGKKGLQRFVAVNDGDFQQENGSFALFDTRARMAKGNADSRTPESSTKNGGAGSLDIQTFPDLLTHSMTPSSLRDWDFALQGTTFGREATGMVRPYCTRLDRVVVEAAYDTIALLEQPLQEKLLVFLRSREDVVIVGPKASSGELRVPTISFVHTSKSSADIAGILQNAGFAVRHGHMHYFRLVSGLVANSKLTVNSVNDGAVRISMVHYNTPIEVTRLIACLQAIL